MKKYKNDCDLESSKAKWSLGYTNNNDIINLYLTRKKEITLEIVEIKNSIELLFCCSKKELFSSDDAFKLVENRITQVMIQLNNTLYILNEKLKFCYKILNYLNKI